MKKQQKWLGLIAGAVASLAISSTSMAAELPLDNRLPAWGDWGTETVDFTNIDINYTNGKKTRISMSTPITLPLPNISKRDA